MILESVIKIYKSIFNLKQDLKDTFSLGREVRILLIIAVLLSFFLVYYSIKQSYLVIIISILFVIYSIGVQKRIQVKIKKQYGDINYFQRKSRDLFIEKLSREEELNLNDESTLDLLIDYLKHFYQKKYKRMSLLEGYKNSVGYIKLIITALLPIVFANLFEIKPSEITKVIMVIFIVLLSIFLFDVIKQTYLASVGSISKKVMIESIIDILYEQKLEACKMKSQAKEQLYTNEQNTRRMITEKEENEIQITCRMIVTGVIMIIHNVRRLTNKR